MQKWEINVFLSRNAVTSAVAKTDTSDLWKKKDFDGQTDLDSLNEIASEGWELVSATPITYGGTTQNVLFTFKRPKE